MTKFKSQALHIIRIKYWKSNGSGNTPSLIPALRKIAIYVLKTKFYVLFCTRLYTSPKNLIFNKPSKAVSIPKRMTWQPKPLRKTRKSSGRTGRRLRKGRKRLRKNSWHETAVFSSYLFWVTSGPEGFGLRFANSCLVFLALPSMSKFAVQIRNNFNWLRTMWIEKKVLRGLSNHKVLWFS